MPELPEVETIRQDLRKKILNKKIKSVFVSGKAKVNKSHPAFKKYLIGKKFVDIDRVGKLIIFVLDNKKYLLVHLKMTGQLIYKNGKKIIAGGHPEPRIDEVPNKFTRVSFELASGGNLYFNDVRRFGYVNIVGQEELDKIKSNFGIEPLQPDFTLENFKKALSNRRTSIKAVLLNQKLLAGIGNIYADESCFLAEVRPAKPVNKLTGLQVKKLHKAIEKVINKAIEMRGTTFNDYKDSEGNSGYFGNFLKVYGRGGEKCVKCKDILKRTVVVGRGTVYCLKCQK